MHQHPDERTSAPRLLHAAIAALERVGGPDALSGLAETASYSRLPQVAPYLVCIPSGHGLATWLRMLSGEDPALESLCGTRFAASVGLPVALVTGEPLRPARVVGLFLGAAAWIHPWHRGMGLGRALFTVAAAARGGHAFGRGPVPDLCPAAAAAWASASGTPEVLARAA